MTAAWPPDLHELKGVLLDIDGTLLTDDRAIRGAPEALERLIASGCAVRLLTNTSRRSRDVIARVLAKEGFRLGVEHILTPAVLARRLILESGRRRAALLVPPAARADFEGIEEDLRAPDWVVLGDLGAGFAYETLNAAHRFLRSGATLIALHRNRFWRPPGQEEVLDVGAFVAALEYASATRAVLVGKPAPEFFRLALREVGLRPDEALVVGDDPEIDIAGAASAGCRTALVRTGRFEGRTDRPPDVRPDLVLDSVAGLPAAIYR